MIFLNQLHNYKKATSFYSQRTLLLVLTMIASTLIYGQAINIDINGASNKTESGYTALSGTSGSKTVNGATFSLFGVANGNSRDRNTSNDLLTDFVFNEGTNNIGIGFKIENLPQGTYKVRSWHYDASYGNGSVDVEFRMAGNPVSTQNLVNDFAFSTEPATYEITVDGTSSYELIFRESDGNNRTRFNGISIEPEERTVVKLDINSTSNKTESGYTALSPDSRQANAEGASFSIFGVNSNYHRDRNISNELLTDFAFKDGSRAGIGLRIKDLPRGTYNVRSWHFDGNSNFNNGAINVEFRMTGNTTSTQTLVNNFAFSTEPANYQITVDGTNDYELIFRETGNFNRSRLNAITFESTSSAPPNESLYNLETVADDGVWTWFNDERAIFHNGFLFSGYVLADGRYGVTRYNPVTKQKRESIISTPTSQQRDDHNNPSFTVLPDGKLLIIYAKHNIERQYYYRISKNSTPAKINDWGPELIETTSCRYTYNNTYRLSSESNRIYNYSRCIGFNPSVAYSDDNGQTWSDLNGFIRTSGGRPYFKYATNHTNRIDLIYTDRHPQETSNNSLYHMYYQNGNYRKTDGKFIKSFNNLPINHFDNERGNVIYQYSSDSWGPGDGPDDWIPNGQAWTWDITYDSPNNISAAFQVQRSFGGGFQNDRIFYYYARWNGSSWEKKFIAQGGRSLYSSQRHYGGGMAIDPDNPNVVYISTNAQNPFDLSSVGLVPLNGNQRYEIYRGVTDDNGKTFKWEAVTSNSTVDNLRPIVPENHGYNAHALWFRGNYRSFTNFSTSVVGIFEDNVGLRNNATEHNLSASPILGQKTEINWMHHLPLDGRKVSKYTIQHYLPTTDSPKDIEVISSIDNQSALFSRQIMHHAPALGENYYQVKIEYDNGVVEYSYPSLVVFNEQQSRMAIAPNPATDMLNLDLTNYEGIELNYFITSITGQILREGVFNKNHASTESIDIKSLPNGNYFIYTKTENSSPLTQQFVIMKSQ